MLDLKNVMSGSLLTMDSLLNAQDGIELESLSVIGENQPQDNDNSIPTGDFISLYAQITTSPEPDSIELTELEPTPVPVSNGTVETEQTTNSIEDNVAVAWINSDYYQAEINNEKVQSDEIIEQLIAKPDSLLELTATTPKTNELPLATTAQVALSSELNSLSSNLKSNAPQEQRAEVHAVPLSHQSESEFTKVLETNTFIKSDEIVKTVTLSEDALPEVLSERISLQSISVDGRKNTDFLSDADSSFEEQVQMESDFSEQSGTLIRPKASLLSEVLTSSSVIEPESVVVDTTLINSVPASTQQPVLYSQEKNDLLPNNVMSQFLDLPTDIEQPEWSQHFSEHVAWLGQQGQGINRAVIKLHPEDLGPIEINIKVANGSATINIASHSQQVRDVIDQSLPKLQEMMAEQGLSLSEVTVESETDARQFAQQEQNAREEFAAYEDEELMITPLRKKSTHQGAVDLFA